MSQLLRPIADIATNGWTASSGSDRWAMLDEVSPTDTDYVRSPDNPTTQQLEEKFGPGTGTHAGCTVRARLEARGADTQFDLQLVQGTTVLDSWSEVVTVAEGKVTRPHVSTGISITDAADLRVRIVARGPGVVAEIIAAAMAANSESNRPLPLLASWAASTQYDSVSDNFGFTPAWQMSYLTAGHRIFPWFNLPTPDMASTDGDWSAWVAHFQTVILQCQDDGLPISFVGTQWEQRLYTDSAYFSLPAISNPNVVRASDGVVLAKVSPFGPVGPWEDLGAEWATSDMMAQLQAWYPAPPLVHFWSNNEAQRLQWIDAETDQHYLNIHGTGHTDEYKRVAVAEGYIVRYRALQDAWRDALTSATWRANARFLAYQGFGIKHYARWAGWKEFSLYNSGRIDPQPEMWDGGSPSYYIDGNPARDDRCFSPQVEAMNYPFMRTEAYTLNPDFWLELSVWNGCNYFPTDPTKPNECAALAANFPDYSPERFAGMCQFGMWLICPRLVRDFRDWDSLRNDCQVFVDALAVAVDRIHDNATLRAFWQAGTLVANTSRAHPYQADVPSEYASVNRMFMLTTDLDPTPPWALTEPLDVFVLARVLGTTPSRSWLLYAFSPNDDLADVVVTIPSIGNVTLDATIAGSFYTVAEGSLVATEVV